MDTETQIALLRGIARMPPLGVHAHFRMLSITKIVNSAISTNHVTSAQIWEFVKSHYNLRLLGPSTDSELNLAVEFHSRDFVLPEHDFGGLVALARIATIASDNEENAEDVNISVQSLSDEMSGGVVLGQIVKSRGPGRPKKIHSTTSLLSEKNERNHPLKTDINSRPDLNQADRNIRKHQLLHNDSYPEQSLSRAPTRRTGEELHGASSRSRARRSNTFTPDHEQEIDELDSGEDSVSSKPLLIRLPVIGVDACELNDRLLTSGREGYQDYDSVDELEHTVPRKRRSSIVAKQANTRKRR